MGSIKRRDIWLILLFTTSLAAGIIYAGHDQTAPLPGWLYIPIMMLFALAADARTRDNPRDRLATLFPFFYGAGLTFISLLTQMPVLLWAFIIPNHFPLWARGLWAGLLPILLHPGVERSFYAGFWRLMAHLEKHGYWTRKLWLTIPLIILLFWPFHSRNLSPDGYDWLTHSIHPDHWIRYLREPLGTMLFRWVTLLGVQIGAWPPMVSIGLMTYLCGVASVALLWASLATVCPEKEERFVWLLTALASCGFTQLFMGNVEIYAVLVAAFTLFLFASLKYLHGRCPTILVGLSFALLFVTHLSAGWWIPAFLLLPAIRRSLTQLSGREVLQDTALLISSSALPVLLFATWLLRYGYGGDPAAMWDHFWGPQVMRVGADGEMFRSLGEILSPRVLLTLLNEYFYLSPVACGLLLLLLARPSLPTIKGETAFMATLAATYLIYSIVWRPDRKFPQDWDIFSGLTIPALLFVLLWLRERYPDVGQRCRIIYPFVTFSGSLAILQALYNHFLRVSDWPLPS